MSFMILIIFTNLFIYINLPPLILFFFLNIPPTTEISPLPLPHPLPISPLPNPTRKATRHTAHPRTHRTTRPPRRRQNQPTRIKSLLPPRHPHSLNQRLPTPTRLKPRSEEHTSELQSQSNLVCRLLLETK